MQALNSVGNVRKAMLVTGIGMFTAFLFLVPLMAFAASSTVTLTTDKSYYAIGSTITVSGTVTPAPTASGTSVAVSITAPNGAIADANQFLVSTAGTYSGTFVTGGPTYVNGTYTITANYQGATTSALFTYGNTTTSGGSGTGTTTTVDVTTTVVVSSETTVTESGGQTTTTVSSPGVTTTISSVVDQSTTVTLTSSASSDGTAIAIGAVGLIIAIIAVIMAVLAMRKKK